MVAQSVRLSLHLVQVKCEPGCLHAALVQGLSLVQPGPPQKEVLALVPPPHAPAILSHQLCASTGAQPKPMPE